MDFTREPIVETIITPREGFRLVIRNSKSPGQDEFSVDALEIVSFGTLCFYRHLERPRSFLVPASDFEVVEVREARVPLKAASFEGVVKQSANKENVRAPHKEPRAAPRETLSQKEVPLLKETPPLVEQEEMPPEASIEATSLVGETSPDARNDRRRDRKRGNRRRRGPRDEMEESPNKLSPSQQTEEQSFAKDQAAAPQTTTLLPPPATLIRDDLDRMRKNDQYRNAFYAKEEVSSLKEEDDAPIVPPQLQEEDSPVRTMEESEYKATPLPPEEEDDRGPLWGKGPTLGGDKQ